MVLEQSRYHSLYTERIGGVGRSFFEQTQNFEIQKEKCKIFFMRRRIKISSDILAFCH